MITDAELIAVRSFDRQLAREADAAQRIINRKNSELVAVLRRLTALERELETERARRRRAEFLLNRH